MKWLFWLLLLVSLAFFALMQWGGAWTNNGMQSSPPFNAERIKLLTPASAPPATPTSPAIQPSPPATPPSPHAAAACMEWGDFSGNDLARAAAALDKLKLGDRLAQRKVEHASGYWVYISTLKTRANADKKVAQLKALGVEEYFIVQEAGKWRNAISLGIFKTEDAAQKFLESLKGKGVKSATVGERMSKFTLTVFVLKNPDAGTTAKVVALQNEFPGSELKATTCGVEEEAGN